MLARRSIRKQPNKQGKKARINLQMCRGADRQAELTRWLAVLIRHPWCRVLYRKCGGDDVDQEVKDRGDRDGNFELKNRCRIREYDGKELQDIKVTGKARPDRRRKERMARWSGVWGGKRDLKAAAKKIRTHVQVRQCESQGWAGCG